MFEIKKIGPISFGKIIGTTSLLLGGIFGVIAGLVNIAIGIFTSSTSTIIMGVGIMILVPILYGIMGFILGIIYSFIYNIVAGMVGGIEMELERKNE